MQIAWQRLRRGLRMEVRCHQDKRHILGADILSTDAVTDNGRPIQEDEKMTPARASDGLCSSGYAYSQTLDLVRM